MFFEYVEAEQVMCTIAYILILITTLLCKKLVQNKSRLVQRLPQYVVGGLIIILEILKQLKNALGFDYTSLVSFMMNKRGDTFNTYALPFHFCSFFFFWIVLSIVFYKKEKLRVFFENMSFLWSCAIMILVLFYPESVYGGAIKAFYAGEEFQHTILFHVLAVLYWALGVAIRPCQFELKKIWHAPVAFLIYAAIAIPAAFIFDANYCSILNPDFFAFLQPFLNVGYVLYEIVLVSIGILVSLALYIGIWAIEKLRDKVKDSSLYIVGYWILIPVLGAILGLSFLLGPDTLRPLYALWLTLGAFLCQLPATIKRHLIRK